MYMDVISKNVGRLLVGFRTKKFCLFVFSYGLLFGFLSMMPALGFAATEADDGLSDFQLVVSDSDTTIAPVFDHLVTGFPLDGDHDLLECAACHIGAVFEVLPLGAKLVMIR